MKLSHKGIIIVSVPLIFELGLVFSLMHMLSEANSQNERLAQSQKIMVEAHKLTSSLIYLGKATIAYHFRHKESVRRRIDANLAEVPQIISRLKQLTNGEPTRLQRVARMEQDMHQCEVFFSQMIGQENPGLDTGPIVQIARQAEMSTDALLQEAQAWADEEEKIQATYSEGAELAKTNVNNFLWLTVILDILLAVALSIFFSKSITKRLRVVSDNALLLALRKELNQPLAGSDEINYLDDVFHKVADELRKAEQRKQEFVAMISHDLRTPLTSLQGTLALFAKGAYGELPERAQKRVNNAEGNIFRLINLINQLLDIDKIEAGMLELHPADLDIVPLVHRAIESIQVFAEQNEITLEQPDPSQNLTVRADEERIVQVLINLLSNAIKYSPPGKSVKVNIIENDKFAEIQVIDEGLGIPEDSRQQIFDRFQRIERGKEKHASTGLGLAICKAFVEGHGGKIGVRSVVGQGSTFWFSLPLSKHKQQGANKPEGDLAFLD